MSFNQSNTDSRKRNRVSHEISTRVQKGELQQPDRSRRRGQSSGLHGLGALLSLVVGKVSSVFGRGSGGGRDEVTRQQKERRQAFASSEPKPGQTSGLNTAPPSQHVETFPYTAGEGVAESSNDRVFERDLGDVAEQHTNVVTPSMSQSRRAGCRNETAALLSTSHHEASKAGGGATQSAAVSSGERTSPSRSWSASPFLPTPSSPAFTLTRPVTVGEGGPGGGVSSRGEVVEASVEEGRHCARRLLGRQHGSSVAVGILSGSNGNVVDDVKKRPAEGPLVAAGGLTRSYAGERNATVIVEHDDGLPRLCDGDSLRHALGFLAARELARFAMASTAAQEFALSHASSEICRRYFPLQLGVRESPPTPASHPRRLAFGVGNNPSPPTDGSNNSSGNVTGPGSGDPGVENTGFDASYHPSGAHTSGQQSPGDAGSAGGRGFSVCVLGEHASASGRRRRSRARGPGGLVRCSGSNAKLALPALYHLEACGDLLLGQLKTLPRLDIFRTLQSRAVLGNTQFLTAHMRAVLVDWVVEVAFQFRLSTIALHAAVSALDVCLGKVAVPRCRLQLLGVVCAMIQSQAGGECQVMTTSEAIHICDSQYNPSQVHSTFNIVVSNTQEPTTRTVPATAAEILNRHLRYMKEPSGLTEPLSNEWDRHVKEECVLAGLLIDLSMLDRYMFRFMPGTLAAAALFLARTTAIFFAKEEVMLTPYAVVEKTNREVLRLFEEGVCRPFVPMDEGFEKRPFGAPGLGEFVVSQPREAAAVRKCVDRLWLVQQDFLNHMAGEQSAQPVLFRYQHMFKGIKDKFVPVGSLRLQAWLRLGLIPREDLEALLDKHLPSTVSTRPPSYMRAPATQAKTATAASAAAS